MASEIEESLTEMNNCMALILPDSLNFFSEELTAACKKPIEVSTERHQNMDAWGEQPCCSKDLTKDDERVATKADKENEDSSAESDMEGGVEENMFIRSSGLMSHTYRLDLNVSSGWFVLMFIRITAF